MRFKLDENLGRRTAGLFRETGYDTATVFGQKLNGASDNDVLAVCVEENRVLVTLDLDFANPLRFDPALTPGIAVLRVPALPSWADLDEPARLLLAQLSVASIAGRLWVVARGRVRQYEP